MENVSLHSFLTGFIGFSSALSLLFVLGEVPLAFQNRRNRTLLFLFLGVFLFQGHAYLLLSQEIRRFPHVYIIHLPVAILFGPLLRSYISFLWEEEDSIPFIRWYDWIPFCGILLLLGPFYLSSAEEKLRCLDTAQQGNFPWDLRLGIAGMSLTLLLYLAHILWNLVHRVRWTTIRDKPELRMILSILFVTGASSFLGLSGSIQQISLSRLELSSALIAVLLCALYVIRQSHPEIFSAVKRIVEEEKKYKNTQLKSVDLDRLENKLNNLFEEKKIYKEENLGLARLSEELGISPHQLSEYLNLHLKKNFFQLVNGYRIREAKRLLLHSPETTVLSIAYEVGFQSKSSFNDSFRKEAGLSPTEFRKKTRSKT
ncbi:AraC family transcriptional regulator [Leptospira gomenensis]|uniref:AraC family transcriptional regulator n=1 Tax=Leptospira gomenensis TaxID=2484974 RepID=A0A5F1YI74_9LEPT|nr:helix-turn-helix domain-containing protein [Leptospira gomenensis]TGK37500.1 AraC family transcriptional regulator [Leptospira gomenensis]TGK39493.1 AraC family transcriptional regulator [Leptospira gomenensis]TGK43085.1 AraC family transcriptional regulator [Leptospira gomenensis]TGK55086.1 AraC family transcriptional regulator [Leptospira gomenensis]